ncbi:hypothetical protein SR1949_43540 [Sphaerospermopsis reniformis]|uniref:Uncharacterized protein n=1 Tax=Sphaerospermopsis reniformis TaxID=531300 RepID=A0A480A7Q0_9CYAN|nr:hypothetical protein [Sphaerospermopsis reniformis]GCL39231.1 hypothetical protein SR1949_43540 [Sphaerospermopsis reniformis]
MVTVDSLDTIKDTRVNCYSVIIQLTVAEYLNLVKQAFQNRGGLEGQRDPLKTTTAIRIRDRMIKDIASGAVLPPIVIGVIVPEAKLETIQTLKDDNSFLEFIHEIPKEDFSIIDGMQRTNALNTALNDKHQIKNNKIRIEFWIASQVNSLTYRMLVLNTGQVPWNLRRQIETVFQFIIKEIQQKYKEIEILQINEERRRNRSGQYQASNIIELFLVFGARKEKIDVQEKLADEFTRLDFIESTSKDNFTNTFYEVMYYLYQFDHALKSYQDDNIEGYFKAGKDLFGSQPACVGFVTAIALAILGRPGNEYPQEKQDQKWQDIKQNADKLLEKLKNCNTDEIGKFLDFTTLNEIISSKPVKYNEREFFRDAFKLLIEEKFEIENMNPCWRAY